jgi:hypothetical protein
VNGWRCEGDFQVAGFRRTICFDSRWTLFLKVNPAVFCSKVALPDAILDMTPLPHEDGAPLFKYKLQPGYKVE